MHNALFRRITDHQQSWHCLMESAVCTLMTKSLRDLKRIYHCYVMINATAFSPLQPTN